MKKPAPRKKPADWLDSAGRCGMLTVTPGPAPRHRRGAGNDGEFSKGLYLGCGLRVRQLTFSLPQGVRTFSHALALDEMDKLDFVGLNHYHGIPARMGPQGPEPVPFSVGGPSTAIGWPITPEALGWGARFLYQRYQKPLYISENGLSCRDQVFLDGQVHDPQRIDFLTRYLRALDRAIAGGTDVRGYFHWSLTDNFEWAEGYSQRFGLAYVDYATGRRIPKDSAAWYREVIRANGASL